MRMTIGANAGIGYHWRKSDMNLSTSVSYQIARFRGSDPTLATADLTRNFFHRYAEHALFLYTMPDHRKLRIYYRTSTVAPSVTQLQQVIDNSNPLLLNTGNPDPFNPIRTPFWRDII